jgi:hypothetical protein
VTGKEWIYKLTIWTTLAVKQDLLGTCVIQDMRLEIGTDAGYFEVGFPTTTCIEAGGGVIIPQSRDTPLHSEEA